MASVDEPNVLSTDADSMDDVVEISTDEQVSPQTPEPTMSSPLLDLPAELRNRIWEQAVIEDEVVHAAPWKTLPCYLHKLPSITQASIQTRSESLPIFLAQNFFRIRPGITISDDPEKRRSHLYGPLNPHVLQLRNFIISGCPEPWMRDQCYVKAVIGAGCSWADVHTSKYYGRWHSCGKGEASADPEEFEFRESFNEDGSEHEGGLICRSTKRVADKIRDFASRVVGDSGSEGMRTEENFFELARVAAERKGAKCWYRDF